MLSPNLFIKSIPRINYGDDFSTRESVMKRKPVVNDIRYRPDREKLMMRHQAMMKEQANKAINNTGVSQVPGHTRFGFQTILDHEVKPLHTAPAIVGGNVDWTKMKVSPATQHLQSVLASRRSMSPATSVGSDLKLREPNVNSIHNTM
jgi:hypothetical protein